MAQSSSIQSIQFQAKFKNREDLNIQEQKRINLSQQIKQKLDLKERANTSEIGFKIHEKP